MQTAKPVFEALEKRTLMAADFVGFNQYLENSFRLDDPGFGGNRSAALRAEVRPMMQTRISGDLANKSDVDMFRVELQKGQFLNTSLDLAGTRLTLYDVDAKLMAKMGLPNALYEVPKSGTYYLRLSDITQSASPRAYTLDVRPIGLGGAATGTAANMDMLQTDEGGMLAVRSGNAMHITGPTGHGFSLIGNWTQRTTGRGDATQTTFTLRDSMTIRTVVGDVTAPMLPGMSVQISTSAHQFGRYFGNVESINLGMQLGPVDLMTPFGRIWGSTFNNDIGGFNYNGGGWGIALGSDVQLRDTGLPLNPAVPYIFYTDQKGFTGSFGGVNVNVEGSFGYAVVVDPSDSFFIGAKNVPVVGDVGYGISHKGLIPFSAKAIPTAYNGDDITGNIYMKAGLDISAFNPAIPINIEGDIVIDLDANNDGKYLGGLKTNISRMLASGFSERELGNAVGRVFGDIAIGVNGQVNVGYKKSGFNLSVPVGEGTLIYSGTEQGMFARGRSAEPFAGTPLAMFKPRTMIDINAHAYRNGDFRLLASGTYNPFVYTMRGSLVVDNNGARAEGTMRALGTNVRVTGHIQTDGKFMLRGNARVNLGPLSGNGSFLLRNTGRAVTFGGGFKAQLSTTVSGVEIGGRVNASLNIGVNNRGLTYSGSGSAALFAGGISVGPVISIANNNLGIGVNLGILGKPTINIPLPV